MELWERVIRRQIPFIHICVNSCGVYETATIIEALTTMDALVTDLLWTDFDPIRMAGIPAGRRATVARGADGQLVVFSPVKATDESLKALKNLDGTIASFVIPSRFHDSFFDGYFSHFPESSFFAGDDSIQDHRTWPLTRLTTGSPDLSGFEFLQIGGMPRSQEIVFFHKATGTLIVADLLFNIPAANGWVSRLLMRMADMGGDPRPSRLWRSLIRSDEQFAGSLKTILEWPFDRIIPGHGMVIENDGRSVFENAFARWLA